MLIVCPTLESTPNAGCFARVAYARTLIDVVVLKVRKIKNECTVGNPSVGASAIERRQWSAFVSNWSPVLHVLDVSKSTSTTYAMHVHNTTGIGTAPPFVGGVPLLSGGMGVCTDDGRNSYRFE